MTKCKRGDIALAQIVFTDGTATKKRPVLILSGKQFNDRREEVVVAAITSNTTRKITGDTRIREWKEAGLLYPSTLTGILFTIKKHLLEKKLGTLSPEDLERAERNFREILEL
ncbi:MAG TPA: type II toxin-antitoxin system PemK/MazF family toxin [Candidatus Ozemobacteraceae bacterium]|nr:type II toxin-antitoxin system PemK/MazF family toxin [Candidatus Ozemobacteraceae bacterium]HQG28030.1 type II toxin-antitoxin system PemK/MazF family toxin [Candidatus Ozemobacteraceae bacterium]